jgi:hypothetical protein
MEKNPKRKTFKNPTVTLRVYKGQKLSYNEDGTVQNENQTVKLPHNSKSWDNFIANLIPNGYCHVKVEKICKITRVQDENGIEETEEQIEDESIHEEVKAVFEQKERKLTPQEERIKALEEKLEALTSGKKEKKEKKEEPSEKDLLTEAYKDKFGKKPHHKWDEEKLKEKLAE